MLEIHEAQQIVLRTVSRMPIVEAPLSDALGLVLAEDVAADADTPPFDKSAMDGFAVRFADLAELPATLEVVETIPAGRMPQCEVGAGQASRIMTGAPIPGGADTVVMVEHTEAVDSDGGVERVRIDRAPKQGANICRRGEDIRCGTPALLAGTCIRPAEVALLAALGAARPKVYRRPTVAVLATGDELVEADKPIDGARIRNSNSPALHARLSQLGVPVRVLGIACDVADELKQSILEGLKSDVLMISGGVSMGSFDLIPGVLVECGVELLFEKVAVKPGKPTVFGRHSSGYVFGLPGNPVSTLVIAELFAIPALKQMMGNMPTFPAEPVAVGDRWQNTASMGLPVPMTARNSVTLASRNDGRATLQIKSVLAPGPKGGQMGMGDMKMDVAVEGNQEGTAVIDEATGMVVESTMQYDLNCTVTTTGGPQTMTVPMKVKSTVKMKGKTM